MVLNWDLFFFQLVKKSLTSTVNETTNMQESLDREAKFFGQLAATNESKALIGLFNGQTECKKNNYGKPQRETKLVEMACAVVGYAVSLSVTKGKLS